MDRKEGIDSRLPSIDTSPRPTAAESTTAAGSAAAASAAATAAALQAAERQGRPNHHAVCVPVATRNELRPLAPGGPLEPGRQANPPIRYDTTGWLSGAAALEQGEEEESEGAVRRLLEPRVVVGVMNSSASLPLVRYDTTGRLSGAFITLDMHNDQGDVPMP